MSKVNKYVHKVVSKYFNKEDKEIQGPGVTGEELGSRSSENSRVRVTEL